MMAWDPYCVLAVGILLLPLDLWWRKAFVDDDDRSKRETISKVHETDRGENIGSSLMYRPVACSRLCFDDYYADVASCFKVIAGLDK